MAKRQQMINHSNVDLIEWAPEDDQECNLIYPNNRILPEQCEFLRNYDFHEKMKTSEKGRTLACSTKESCQKSCYLEDFEFPDEMQQILFGQYVPNVVEIEDNILLSDIPDDGLQQLKIEAEILAADQTEKNSHKSSSPTIVLASTLLSLQRKTQLHYEKATNMAKFNTRVFMRRLPEDLPDDKERELHIKFVERYFQKNDRKNKTSADMVFLFGISLNERNNRWAAIRRQIMHQTLASSSKRKLVLENNYIKEKQKVHYLYSLKVYQWRLNNPKLIGNFN